MIYGILTAVYHYIVDVRSDFLSHIQLSTNFYWTIPMPGTEVGNGILKVSIIESGSQWKDKGLNNQPLDSMTLGRERHRELGEEPGEFWMPRWQSPAQKQGSWALARQPAPAPDTVEDTQRLGRRQSSGRGRKGRFRQGQVWVGRLRAGLGDASTGWPVTASLPSQCPWVQIWPFPGNWPG